MQNKEIAERLDTQQKTVGLWRNRFADKRVAGIEKDAPGRGRPKTTTQETVAKIIRMTTQENPSNATHWSTRDMAKVAGVSPTTVRRIWGAHGLKPHLFKTFKLSRDPNFAEKLQDIVGLYLKRERVKAFHRAKPR